MKNFIFSIFIVFTMSLAVTTSANGEETSKQTAKEEVEVKKPSLTFYYFDQ